MNFNHLIMTLAGEVPKSQHRHDANGVEAFDAIGLPHFLLHVLWFKLINTGTGINHGRG